MSRHNVKIIQLKLTEANAIVSSHYNLDNQFSVINSFIDELLFASYCSHDLIFQRLIEFVKTNHVHHIYDIENNILS